MEDLRRKRAELMRASLDSSSRSTYSSAMNSYIHFTSIHNLDMEPTPDTLSLYVVFMSHDIEPRSVDTYLSGIVNELEPIYPEARQNRRHMLVTRTLKGCKRVFSRPIHRKHPVSRDQLQTIFNRLSRPLPYDDSLFAAILFTGFYGLLRLGEMTASDTLAKRDPGKFSLRNSVHWLPEGFSFWLRTHKTDSTFEGSRVVIAHQPYPNPVSIFSTYLQARDAYFPLHPFLWIRANGDVPTRQWFLRRLRVFIPDKHFAGQSLRAGGATALAEDGQPFDLIQAAGRWTSDTFRIYIRKNPTLLQLLLARRRAH